MKKLILLGLLTSQLVASEIRVSYALNVSHVKYGQGTNDYTFNENNNLITLEVDKIGIASFKNSFYNQSYAIYYTNDYNIKNSKFYLNYKLGIIKGYNKIDYLKSDSKENYSYEFNNYNVIYKDIGIFATVGVGYEFNKHLSLDVNVFGNSIVSKINYTF